MLILIKFIDSKSMIHAEVKVYISPIIFSPNTQKVKMSLYLIMAF
jgi:hypothetical protein